MVKQTLKAEVESLEGLKLRCHSRGFEFMIDEPKNVGGTDTAMNPLEALLCSLGACKMMVAKFFYQAKKMDLSAMSVRLEGEIDSNRLKGDPDIKIGFSKITTFYTIKAKNSNEEIKEFVDFIEKTCPVKDTIVNTPEFETKIEIEE